MPHYPNAPITEAIIDLQVQLEPDVTVDALAAVNRGLEAKYPDRKQLKTAHGEMKFGKVVGSSAEMQDVGFAFQSADGKQIHQTRLDGFTMNRLAPYEDWERFRTEARQRWDCYREIAKPTKIKRLAVRYINRLDLPRPFDDFGEYLRTQPEISRDLPQKLAQFVMRLVLPFENPHCVALINETIVGATEDVVSVALDIDIYRDKEVPAEDTEIWELFEQLRERKNEVFEACITDKARRLFA